MSAIDQEAYVAFQKFYGIDAGYHVLSAEWRNRFYGYQDAFCEARKMTNESTLAILDLLGDVMRAFCPYENAQRQKLLDKLKALETKILESKNQAGGE